MKSTINLTTCTALLDQWNAQVRERLERSFGPRPLAVVRWLTRFKSTPPLIDLRNLRATVLHDHNVPGERPRIRLAGYWCRVIEEGVLIGGAAGIRFEKNVALSPRAGVRGSRIDATDIPLLRSALLLDAKLSAAANDSATTFPKRLRLPLLWSAFEPAIAESVQGSGPELCGLCHSSGESSNELLRRFRRFQNGLVLFPHEWVCTHWPQARMICADLSGIPRCQVIDCSGGFEELHGFRAACEFDFLGSRFGSNCRSRSFAPSALVLAG